MGTCIIKSITVIYIEHVTTYSMFRYSSFFLQVWSLPEFLFLYKYQEETQISASTGPDSSEEHGTIVDETEESHHIAMYTGNIIDLAKWILVIDQQQNPAISQSTNIYNKPKTFFSVQYQLKILTRQPQVTRPQQGLFFNIKRNRLSVSLKLLKFIKLENQLYYN